MDVCTHARACMCVCVCVCVRERESVCTKTHHVLVNDAFHSARLCIKKKKSIVFVSAGIYKAMGLKVAEA